MNPTIPWSYLVLFWLIPSLLSILLFVIARYLPGKSDGRCLFTGLALVMLIGGLGFAALITYTAFLPPW
jgi:hypothetical protein